MTRFADVLKTAASFPAHALLKDPLADPEQSPRIPTRQGAGRRLGRRLGAIGGVLGGAALGIDTGVDAGSASGEGIQQAIIGDAGSDMSDFRRGAADATGALTTLGTGIGVGVPAAVLGAGLGGLAGHAAGGAIGAGIGRLADQGKHPYNRGVDRIAKMHPAQARAYIANAHRAGFHPDEIRGMKDAYNERRKGVQTQLRYGVG